MYRMECLLRDLTRYGFDYEKTYNGEVVKEWYVKYKGTYVGRLTYCPNDFHSLSYTINNNTIKYNFSNPLEVMNAFIDVVQDYM